MLETITESQGFEILDLDHALPRADPATLPAPPCATRTYAVVDVAGTLAVPHVGIDR